MLRDDIEIAKRAIEKGFITSDQLREVLSSKGADSATTVGRKDPVPIGTMLVERGFLKPDQLTVLISELRGVPSPRPQPAPPSDQADPPAPTPAVAPSTSMPTTPAGQQSFGKFMLVNRLGEGRSGPLWRAWQKNLRRWVTLRIPRPGSAAERALFVEGAQRAAMLEHANILRTFEVGLHEQMPFAAMEYLKGRTLDRAAGLPQKRLLEIMIDAANAVQFAHERNVVHGNIKPSNVMLAETGDNAAPERVVVLDFAIPASGACPSTAPELAIAGTTATIAGDVYGLGATLYHLLAGRPPYQGPAPLDIAAQIAHNDPPWPKDVNPQVSSELDAVVRRAMARQPEARFASARELATELKSHLRRGAVGVASRRRISRIVPPEHPPGRGMLYLYVAGAVAILAMIAGIVVLLLMQRGPTRVSQAPAATSGDPRELALPFLDEAHKRFREAQELLYRPTTTMEPYFAGLRSCLAELDSALQRHSGFAEAHVLRGQVLLLQDKDAEAEASFTVAAQADAKSIDALLGRAAVMLRRIDQRIDRIGARESAKRRREPTAAAVPDPFSVDPELPKLRDRALADLRAALDRGLDPYETGLANADIARIEWKLGPCREALDRMAREHRAKEEVFMRRGRLLRYLAMEQIGTAVPENERRERHSKALDAAAADFDQVTSLRQNDVDSLVQAGDTYIEQGTPEGYEKAAKRYQDALRLNPKHAAALYQLAWCRLHQQRPSDAKHLFGQCYDVTKQKDYLLLRAHAALQAGDGKDLEYCGGLLEKNHSDNALTWIFKAMRHWMAQELDDMDQVLRKGHNAVPSDPTIHYLWGACAEDRGQLGEAIKRYGDALSYSEEFVAARTARAFALSQRREPRDAIEEIRRIKSPDKEVVALAGALMLLAKDAPGAVGTLEQIAGQHDAQVYAIGNLGLACLWTNQRERALQYLKQARDRAQEGATHVPPDQTGALRRFWHPILVNYALALRDAGRKEEAVQAARDAVAWSERASDIAHLVYAEALEAAGTDAETAANERQMAGSAVPTRGLVMIAHQRKFAYRISHGRPGWPAEPQDFDPVNMGIRRPGPVTFPRE